MSDPSLTGGAGDRNESFRECIHRSPPFCLVYVGLFCFQGKFYQQPIGHPAANKEDCYSNAQNNIWQRHPKENNKIVSVSPKEPFLFSHFSLSFLGFSVSFFVFRAETSSSKTISSQ